MKTYSTAPLNTRQHPLDLMNDIREALDTLARVNNLGISFGISVEPHPSSGLPPDVDPPTYFVVCDERGNSVAAVEDQPKTCGTGNPT